MSTPPREAQSSLRRRATAVGLVAAGALTGGILVTTMSATAATSTADSTGSAVTTTTGGGLGDHGRPDETPVTGTKLTTLKAAALKAVPGGTIVRVETDAGDGAYEAHMTKADGTAVTVKFDASLKVIGVEDGMGKGDPAPAAANGSTE